MSRLFLAVAIFLSIAVVAAPVIMAQPEGAPPAAAEAGVLEVATFTGEIQVEVDGVVTNYAAGAIVPPLPSGAKVNVLSGEAVFVGNGVAVNAAAGANFSVSAEPVGNTTQVSIAADSGSTAIQAEVGGNILNISGGSTAGVKLTPGAASVVTAETGSITIEAAGGETTTLAEGQTQAVVDQSIGGTPPAGETEVEGEGESEGETTEGETEGETTPPSDDGGDTPTESASPPPPPPPSPPSTEDQNEEVVNPTVSPSAP